MRTWKAWKRWRTSSGRTSGKSRIYEGRRREKTEIRIEVVGICAEGIQSSESGI